MGGSFCRHPADPIPTTRPKEPNMSEVIRLLETMGRNPAVSAAEYAASVALLELEPSQRQPFLDRDPVSLGDLVGARVQMMCLILPAEDEPSQGDEGEEAPEKAPDQDAPSEQ
jgi:hypothetical protein